MSDEITSEEQEEPINQPENQQEGIPDDSSEHSTEDMIDEEDESFADLFESYNAGVGDNLRVGDKVQGDIISIGMDTVFVNTGSKIDGAVDKSELLDDEGELPYAVGDILELYVVKFEENEIRLSKAISGIGGLNLLKDAYEARVPVEGRVKETCKGGFRIEMMQRLAFCPVSQIDTHYVETPEDFVGNVYPFRITRFEENGRNIVVSRRELLMEEQRETKAAYLETLAEDAVVEGRVTKIMPYGAFVELTPGLEGMVHISELSWSRVETPDAVVKAGDIITVKVLGIEPGKKPGEHKISLSVKQATGDPWDEDTERFKSGEKVRGTVTRCQPFGAFVEIAPGIEGLVHVSEMSYAKRVHHPSDMVSPGDAVDVMIKEVDLLKRRISLSMRDAEGDPWIDIREKYKIGQHIQGTVEKVEKFGIFITITPGITGLLPKSKISGSEHRGAIEKMKAGDSITVVIDSIRADERKISLRPDDVQESDDWKQYSKSSGGSLGSLGEKLQEALKSKK